MQRKSNAMWKKAEYYYILLFFDYGKLYKCISIGTFEIHSQSFSELLKTYDNFTLASNMVYKNEENGLTVLKALLEETLLKEFDEITYSSKIPVLVKCSGLSDEIRIDEYQSLYQKNFITLDQPVVLSMLKIKHALFLYPDETNITHKFITTETNLPADSLKDTPRFV